MKEIKTDNLPKNRWHTELADNGWLDWYCPYCGKLFYNYDIHVSIDYKYCPYCGQKVED